MNKTEIEYWMNLNPQIKKLVEQQYCESVRLRYIASQLVMEERFSAIELARKIYNHPVQSASRDKVADCGRRDCLCNQKLSSFVKEPSGLKDFGIDESEFEDRLIFKLTPKNLSHDLERLGELGLVSIEKPNKKGRPTIYKLVRQPTI